MATDAVKFRTYTKKLLPFDQLDTAFLSYLSTITEDIGGTAFDLPAAIKTAIPVTAPGNRNISVGAAGGPFKAVTGLGRLVKFSAADSRLQAVPVPFDSLPYNVALESALVEDQIEVNPRTGDNEYRQLKEDIGRITTPSAVAWNGTNQLTLTLQAANAFEAGKDNTGRQITVWLVPKQQGGPGPKSASAAVAFFTGSLNASNQLVLNSATPLGQATASVSTLASDYRCLIKGPTVRRVAVEDLTATSGAIFLATFTTPASAITAVTAIVTTAQKLVTFSLSDLSSVFFRDAHGFMKVQVTADASDAAQGQVIVKNNAGTTTWSVDETGTQVGCTGTFTATVGNGNGLNGTGAGSGSGGNFTGGPTSGSAGATGTGGAGGGNGLLGIPVGLFSGVVGRCNGTAGSIGVFGDASSGINTNIGVSGLGSAATASVVGGNGVSGTGGAATAARSGGHGVAGVGGAIAVSGGPAGNGVVGTGGAATATGTTAGDGGSFSGGNNSFASLAGNGVTGNGGTSAGGVGGIGVRGNGGSNSPGVLGYANSYEGVVGLSGGGAYSIGTGANGITLALQSYVGFGVYGSGGGTSSGVAGIGGGRTTGLCGAGAVFLGGTGTSTGNGGHGVETQGGNAAGAGQAAGHGLRAVGGTGTGGATHGDGIQCQSGNTGQGGYGIKATGFSAGGWFTGTGGPGVMAIGNTAASSRGALNLNNQSAIGAAGLLAGDLFWDGTNLRFCKVNGASVIVI